MLDYIRKHQEELKKMGFTIKKIDRSNMHYEGDSPTIIMNFKPTSSNIQNALSNISSAIDRAKRTGDYAECPSASSLGWALESYDKKHGTKLYDKYKSEIDRLEEKYSS